MFEANSTPCNSGAGSISQEGIILLAFKHLTNEAKMNTLSNYVSWKISIPRILAEKVEARIHDPFSGRPMYGYRSRLVVAMLQTWLNNPTNAEAVKQTLQQLKEDKSNDDIAVDTKA